MIKIRKTSIKQIMFRLEKSVVKPRSTSNIANKSLSTTSMLIEIFISNRQLKRVKAKANQQNRSMQRSKNTMWAKIEKLQGSKRMKFATLRNSIKFQQGVLLGNDKIRLQIYPISLILPNSSEEKFLSQQSLEMLLLKRFSIRLIFSY